MGSRESAVAVAVAVAVALLILFAPRFWAGAEHGSGSSLSCFAVDVSSSAELS